MRKKISSSFSLSCPFLLHSFLFIFIRWPGSTSTPRGSTCNNSIFSNSLYFYNHNVELPLEGIRYNWERDEKKP